MDQNNEPWQKMGNVNLGFIRTLLIRGFPFRTLPFAEMNMFYLPLLVVKRIYCYWTCFLHVFQGAKTQTEGDPLGPERIPLM